MLTNLLVLKDLYSEPLNSNQIIKHSISPDSINNKERIDLLNKELATAIDIYLKSHSQEKLDQITSLFVKIFSKFAIDPEKALRILKTSSVSLGKNGLPIAEQEVKTHYIEYVRENILAMIEIDQISPGCVSKLFSRFGICNFVRYPYKALIEMLNISPDERYGYMIFASMDNNSSMSNPENYKLIYSIYNQLRSLGFRLVIMEAASPLDIQRKLLKVSRRQNNRSSFIIVEAHGGKKKIMINDKEYMSIEDITSPKITKMSESLLDDDATVIYNVCKAGMPESFAEKSRDQFDIKTIGPNSDNSFLYDIKITANTVNGSPIFTTVYKNSDTNSQVKTGKFKVN